MTIHEATPIRLSLRERAVLEAWSRADRETPRQAERARIVLMAADGIGTRRIAHALGCTIGTASKWRVRFASDRIEGLADRPRPGATPRYDTDTDRRILALLERPPPSGRRMWTGALLSEALGDVSDQYIWRFLRRRGIGQGDRRTWHLNVGAPFRGRAVDIVALYLHPIENALLFSAQRGGGGAGQDGYVRVPRGGIPLGIAAGESNPGGSALMAAIDAAGRRAERRGGPEDPPFSLDRLIDATATAFADRRIVAVVDGAAAAAGRLLAAHRNVHVMTLAGREAWLGQLAVSLTLLVGADSDPNARLRAEALSGAVRRFLARADAAGPPFIWGRKNPDATAS